MSTTADTALLSLTDRYANVRGQTEALASPLSPEDQTVQSMPDVSPTKWHRAHTTWFFETFLLEPFAPGYRPVNEAYAFLFNSYYEAVGARHTRAERGLISRPGVGEVTRYRDVVDEAMTGYLAGVDPSSPTGWLVELGLHHEQQHQELLLMDIKHVLSRNPLRPSYAGTRKPAGAGPDAGVDRSAGFDLGWLPHDGGIAEVGAGGDGFTFDNERPCHRVLLHPFELADRPVTCAEWMAFIDDGGYRRPELWLSDGWAAVQAGVMTAPLYWSPGTAGWEVFSLRGSQPVRAAEPVCHVSYYEADAYARWAGARLPTEAEWEAVLGDAVDPAAGVELHPRLRAGTPSVGQVWEWTASAYLPYPGFRPEAGAVGEYNGKFMVNQHVLRGGCCVTPVGHIRGTYRNFFPPSARWPFTGLRLARDAA